MTTRIQSFGPRAAVHEDRTAARVTPPPTRPFRQILDAGAGAVLTGAESATRQLPGGPILAAAFRSGVAPGGGVAPVAASTGGMSLPEGSSGTAAGESGLLDGAPLDEADQALYYLQLQQQISAESRAYTALSNVLKARHDTVKNAIGNIR